MLCFHVSNRRQRRQIDHAGGPLEFGAGPPRGDVARCTLDDPAVSLDHLRVEELPGGRVDVHNLSPGSALRLADHRTIPAGGRLTVPLPVLLTVGETLIDIEPGTPTRAEQLSLASLEPVSDHVQTRLSLLELGEAPAPEVLVRWFETVIRVQRAAATSPEFHQHTAQAVVDLIGLDRGLVLLRHGDNWEVAARAGAAGPGDAEFSQTILGQMLQGGRTVYQSSADPVPTGSLRDVEAVVASPVQGPAGRIVGVVYGSRARGETGSRPAIGPLESRLVQVLASAVSAGLARVEQEAEAARLRVQFEQFFSVDLARELQRNPALLEGQEREVTVLFSDIRGFSRLSERLAARDTCRLVGDLMERLTARVHESGGVVVDYQGDGLLAMWNAPRDIPRHAEVACRAAQAILTDLPVLSAGWEAVTGAPLRLGIGLNTGLALVGNTGSRQKFKYGALGHAVNVGSRVEGATKQFGLPLLITGSTRAQLGGNFPTRRLCKARVVGIAGPVDLYELLAGPVTAGWLAQRDAYEQALVEYESGHWAASCNAIYALLSRQTGDHDVPSLMLGSRAAAYLNNPPASFDPVIELGSK